MRNRGYVVLLGVATAMPSNAVARCDYTEQHAIARDFVAAVERSGGVTVDMRDAQSAAHQAWDVELNRIYRELVVRLPRETDRAALRAAQRAWIAFDTAEGKWDWSAAMHGEEGTAGPLNVASASLLRLERRVCDLQEALEWLDVSPGVEHVEP